MHRTQKTEAGPVSHTDPRPGTPGLVVPSHYGSAGPLAPSMRTGEQMGLDAQVFNRLLKERIVFLGSPVMDEIANAICAQLLLLAAEDPDRDIHLYINSPGGSVSAGMAIYDTMQYVRPDVRTACLGQAASAAAVLLAAGTPGKRMALPNSRVLIHQPATEGIYGQVSDLEIQANEVQRMRELLETTLAKHTSRTQEQVRDDIERDKILTAEQAKEYGIVDEIMPYRKLSAQKA